MLIDVYNGVEHFGSVVLPAVDGLLPAPVVADAVADEFGWELLGHFFDASIYSTLELRESERGVSVTRGSVVIAEIAGADLRSFDRPARHARIGWTVFLQELWGLPSWPSDRFYMQDRKALVASRRRIGVGDLDPIWVEIAEELPDVVATEQAHVHVTLAGVPVLDLDLRSEHGATGAAALRRVGDRRAPLRPGAG